MLPSDVIFAMGELPSLGCMGKALEVSQTPLAFPLAPCTPAEDGNGKGCALPPFPRPSPPACHHQMSPVAAGPFVSHCEQMSETLRRM